MDWLIFSFLLRFTITERAGAFPGIILSFLLPLVLKLSVQKSYQTWRFLEDRARQSHSFSNLTYSINHFIHPTDPHSALLKLLSQYIFEMLQLLNCIHFLLNFRVFEIDFFFIQLIVLGVTLFKIFIDPGTTFFLHQVECHISLFTLR